MSGDRQDVSPIIEPRTTVLIRKYGSGRLELVLANLLKNLDENGRAHMMVSRLLDLARSMAQCIDAARIMFLVAIELSFLVNANPVDARLQDMKTTVVHMFRGVMSSLSEDDNDDTRHAAWGNALLRLSNDLQRWQGGMGTQLWWQYLVVPSPPRLSIPPRNPGIPDAAPLPGMSVAQPVSPAPMIVPPVGVAERKSSDVQTPDLSRVSSLGAPPVFGAPSTAKNPDPALPHANATRELGLQQSADASVQVLPAAGLHPAAAAALGAEPSPLATPPSEQPAASEEGMPTVQPSPDAFPHSETLQPRIGHNSQHTSRPDVFEAPMNFNSGREDHALTDVINGGATGAINLHDREEGASPAEKNAGKERGGTKGKTKSGGRATGKATDGGAGKGRGAGKVAGRGASASAGRGKGREKDAGESVRLIDRSDIKTRRKHGGSRARPHEAGSDMDIDSDELPPGHSDPGDYLTVEEAQEIAERTCQDFLTRASKFFSVFKTDGREEKGKALEKAKGGKAKRIEKGKGKRNNKGDDDDNEAVKEEEDEAVEEAEGDVDDEDESEDGDENEDEDEEMLVSADDEDEDVDDDDESEVDGEDDGEGGGEDEDAEADEADEAEDGSEGVVQDRGQDGYDEEEGGREDEEERGTNTAYAPSTTKKKGGRKKIVVHDEVDVDEDKPPVGKGRGKGKKATVSTQRKETKGSKVSPSGPSSAAKQKPSARNATKGPSASQPSEGTPKSSTRKRAQRDAPDEERPTKRSNRIAQKSKSITATSGRR
ncbi:unnamed protein product [Peniophora sp. CBMAI 1063]|nr:unnamed protein product [Peniophora sp. CBMAI 1063]